MRQSYIHLLLLLSLTATSAADVTTGEDDEKCLKGVQDSLGDPDKRLSSWVFTNTTVGFVCSFGGVSCWNPQENRVIALNLPSMSLTGSIPSSLQYCRSVTSLDLSGNSLSGKIPPALCDWLPFLVSLDLSSNNLTGPIPSELANCRFLNSLKLASNILSGPIPASLSRLDRLKTLDFSNNQLTGSIPAQFSSFDAADFANNPSLCGGPLSSCGARSRRSLAIIIAAGVFGATISLLFAFFVYRWFFSVSAKGKMGKTGAEDGRWWAERLGSTHNRFVQVSLFQKPIVKVKLADLMVATRNFHPDNIVTAGSSRAGTSYRAILRDGSDLTVKRLHSCPLSEKAFRSEMGQFGQLRHPNLVPLLGFCVVEDERLLVSSAILLDDDYEARITDVCLTRLVRGSPGEGGDTSPFLNGDFGEFGYIAPEYASNPVGTTKGDVYAFGVVLLELATGQEAAMVAPEVAGEGFKGNLVDWASQLAGAGRVGEVIDRSIFGMGFDNEIVDFIKVAIGCVSARPKERFSMYRTYHSLKVIGTKYDASEQYDEFPLTYCKDESDTMNCYNCNSMSFLDLVI
ncbi:putative inactive receptor kinase [Carex littledalei]|uniref:Putative inactive receptor kinase n=1 Tax=Carex littledalei TaxID=544730 RepID=A0A833VQW5_9POAL|nr:putative inactive receptor kinase [Carex littledalei]